MRAEKRFSGKQDRSCSIETRHCETSQTTADYLSDQNCHLSQPVSTKHRCQLPQDWVRASIESTPWTHPFTVFDEIIDGNLFRFRWIDTLARRKRCIADRPSTKVETYLKDFIDMLLKFLIFDSRLTDGTKKIVEGKHNLFHILQSPIFRENDRQCVCVRDSSTSRVNCPSPLIS